ncbi:hypothetical protein [Paraliomyxa miuraensis]|uniref:hypothetical protein n=1 Tax=Paraliomyxa miuraensis TaxID=376150 RepID=UPI00225B117A|nr:hypothetical protein [Paraliomyxa miuraensis]MCX4239302.1 hypothetical protein [Paraliomyxa miuraensis]
MVDSPLDSLGRNLWPVGYVRAIVAAQGRARAEATVFDLRDPADRDVAAAMLIELIYDARQQREFDHAAELYETLKHGTGPWRDSPIAVWLRVVEGIVGADIGSIRLHTPDGEVLDTADLEGKPILLYTAARARR